MYAKVNSALMGVVTEEQNKRSADDDGKIVRFLPHQFSPCMHNTLLVTGQASSCSFLLLAFHLKVCKKFVLFCSVEESKGEFS